jgi:hypothetical protein
VEGASGLEQGLAEARHALHDYRCLARQGEEGGMHEAAPQQFLGGERADGVVVREHPRIRQAGQLVAQIHDGNAGLLKKVEQRGVGVLDKGDDAIAGPVRLNGARMGGQVLKDPTGAAGVAGDARIDLVNVPAHGQQDVRPVDQ